MPVRGLSPPATPRISRRDNWETGGDVVIPVTLPPPPPPEPVWTTQERLASLLDPSAKQPNEKYRLASLVIAALIFLLILLSVTNFVVQSLPQYKDDASFVYIEAVCVSLFTAEMALKLYSFRLVTLLKDYHFWIDIAAILPFYLDLFMNLGKPLKDQSSAVNLIFLRLAKIFRLLKLGNYSKPFRTVILVLSNSVDAVLLLIFLCFLSVILFSSLLWIAEQSATTFDSDQRAWVRDDGTLSPFQSIPHTFWWCMCTLTTVGYGDDVPVSTLGKIVASVTIIVGVFVLAFPVILISYNYSEMVQGGFDADSEDMGDIGAPDPDCCPHCGEGGHRGSTAAGHRGSLLLGDLRPLIQGRGSWKGVEPSAQVGALLGSWREDGRTVRFYYGGRCGRVASAVYDPLLRVCAASPAEVCRCFRIEVAFRTPAADHRVAKAVTSILGDRFTVPEAFVGPRRIIKASVSIPGLPHGCQVATGTFHRPGDALTVDVLTPTPESLSAICSLAPHLSMNLELIFKPLPLGLSRKYPVSTRLSLRSAKSARSEDVKTHGSSMGFRRREGTEEGEDEDDEDDDGAAVVAASFTVPLKVSPSVLFIESASSASIGDGVPPPSS